MTRKLKMEGSLKYERVRIEFTPKEVVAYLEGGDFESAEFLSEGHAGSFTLVLPFPGKVPYKLVTG